MSTAAAGVAASEYDISPQEAADASVETRWRAVNRAQDLRVDFTEEGIRFRPRLEQRWGRGEFGLKALAWAGRPLPPRTGERVSPLSGNRIEYTREGMTEWYLSDPAGVEQGFVLPVAATGRDGRGALVLGVEGVVAAVPSNDGRTIVMRPPRGGVAGRFGEVSVVDGEGRVLPSRLEVVEEQDVRAIRIIVDTTAAADPLTLRARITGSPGSGAADPRPVSGLRLASVSPAPLSGAVPDWTVGSGQARADIGLSVASAGDVNGDGFADVIVGAGLFDNGQTDEGRAFVYLGSAAGLSTTPAWTAEVNQTRSHFGASVASAGDVNGDGFDDVIVGAPNYSQLGYFDDGAAFVYLGSASGLATSPVWSGHGLQDFAELGVSVASAGDVNGDGYADVIVGADGYNTATEPDAGRVLVYAGSPAGPATTPLWTADGDQAFAYFGSVASAGDVNGDGYDDVIVGAYLEDGPEVDEGRALVYYGSASGLGASPAWSAGGDRAGAQFGLSVASAGDVNGDGFDDVIVGAYAYDGAFPACGRAFLYQGSASGLSPSAAWTADGDQASAAFGISVASAGDENNDGFDDVVVGAQWEDAGQTDEGRIALFRGSSAGLRSFAQWTAESDQAGAYLGVSVAGAGDVNGDGFADVIAGAPGLDRTQTDEGAAFVYLGPKTAPDTDGDGVPDAADCAPADGTVFAVPGQIRNLGFLTKDMLRWDSDAAGSGTGTRYDAMSGSLGQLPVGGGAAERCLEPASIDTTTQDTTLPAAGAGLYYLVRGRNTCGTGSWGLRSNGAERTTTVCP